MATRTEEFKLDGGKVLDKIKELIHEGNIRRVIIKDREGKAVMEIPMTLGVMGVLIAPQLAALGALAALLTIFNRTDCFLPSVAHSKIVPFNNTASGETNKPRLHIGKQLNHIGTHASGAVFPCI